MTVKRVAIIGLGPGGAIAIDALAQEKAFETIRVFERRDAPGGCWLVVSQNPALGVTAEPCAISFILRRVLMLRQDRGYHATTRP
jgi:cation diffusion facilitator CzcD-associated flavoprotein CzcO